MIFYRACKIISAIFTMVQSNQVSCFLVLIQLASECNLRRSPLCYSSKFTVADNNSRITINIQIVCCIQALILFYNPLSSWHVSKVLLSCFFYVINSVTTHVHYYISTFCTVFCLINSRFDILNVDEIQTVLNSCTFIRIRIALSETNYQLHLRLVSICGGLVSYVSWVAFFSLFFSCPLI